MLQRWTKKKHMMYFSRSMKFDKTYKYKNDYITVAAIKI